MKRKFIVIILIALMAVMCMAACGHTHKYEDRVVPPTCTEDGYIEHECACGYRYRDNVIAAAHKLTLVSEKPSACAEKGHSAYYECSACNKWFGDEEGKNEIADKNSVLIKKLPHDYVDRVCTECGSKQPTEGLDYTKIDGKEEYAVTGMGKATDTDIVIAEEYNDKPVTSIGEVAFSYCEKIISVTIPDSVISIGDYSFTGCFELTSVTIGDGVASIGGSAFRDCISLTSIVVSDGNGVYHSDGNCLIATESKTIIVGCKNSVIPDDGSVTSIGTNAFYMCRGLMEITIPIGITSIGGGAFQGCDSLTVITIPDSVMIIGDLAFSYCNLTSVTIGSGVMIIGDLAFYYCRSLTSLTIPDNVKSIGERAFSGCYNLTSIVVSEENSAYYSVGNCLISSKSNTLIAGCKNSVIPDDGSVTSIGAYAFYGCSGLMNITIPNGVTNIGESAFQSCGNLKSITIPNSVTSIGNTVLFNCEGLTSVYYKGTEEEWNDINIGLYNNGKLEEVTRYYYSETEPTTDGNYWYYDNDGNIVVWGGKE